MEFSGCNAHYEGRQFGVLPESLQGSEMAASCGGHCFLGVVFSFRSTANPRALMLAGLRVEASSQ